MTGIVRKGIYVSAVRFLRQVEKLRLLYRQRKEHKRNILNY
jgi:hypothetical protein